LLNSQTPVKCEVFMDLIRRYQQAIDQHGLDHDPAQFQVVEALQHTSRQLIQAEREKSRLYSRIGRWFGFKPEVVPGVYLWGSVGRGKTWLMHLFYDNLPLDNKLRLHFHHFMLDVHTQLGQLQKQKDPLRLIAKNYALKYRVICLDEFIVTNITDAMLLYGLLDALFSYGVTLVATSNRIPDDLYKNGLQRERFVPTIALIKRYTRVIQLDSPTDHRLKLLEQSDVYYWPLDEHSDSRLEARFRALANSEIVFDTELTVLKRQLACRALADEIAWFDFEVLCNTPRAAQDYIELARDYHTLFLSNVPIMDESMDDRARRFIYLIDELYDRRVKLILSADAQPVDLYNGDMLAFAFHRTSSRLIEMRSSAYLRQPHHAS
jgi:cell division protein ZapE